MELDNWLADIAEKMRSASFSPRSIERITRELADHHQDILDASTSNNSHEAISRLGTADAILRAADQQRTSAKPWFYFFVLPCLELVAGWIVLAWISFIVVNTLAILGINANQTTSPWYIRWPVGWLWSGVPGGVALFVSWRAYRRLMNRDNRLIWSAATFGMLAFIVAFMESPVHLSTNSMMHGLNTQFDLAWISNPFRLFQIFVPLVVLVIGCQRRIFPVLR